MLLVDRKDWLEGRRGSGSHHSEGSNDET